MDTGGMAWLLISAALVLLMTPGLAFFYGGMVKEKSVISMMMLSFGALGLIAVLWILYGYSMSSVSGDSFFQFAGNPFADFAMTDLTSDNESLAGAAYGATFAIITTALISGAIADRAKFGSWLLFAGIFATFVYFPVAAWVWGGGWIMQLGTALGFDGVEVIDYAGGTAVHINAGAAALALAIVLGRRVGFADKGKEMLKPHNVPLVMLGTALLWFGWFGFNAGAEGNGNLIEGIPGLIFVNTIAAPAAAILGWIAVEKIRNGKPTAIGAASGAVAGLVAITPACAVLTPGWSLLLGLLAGILCCLAVDLKYKLGYDDSLDVVGLHLVGGLLGSIFPGFFAFDTGLFTGGDARQLVVQVIASLSVLVYSFVVSFLVAWAIQKTIGFRITHEDEAAGIDVVVHGETGYALAR
ncbi:ammonium transporter [Pseudoclavibacter chungangensis]|uniref:Ammonium transporter n=1 Tax=Pseudoclavibacter chungangensis TaxID=587635 RepID=A0A7J5BQE9_9MICO|nr:ammonium transporter [Pseudoclavibacter chungangensis]KAB1656016.1 ammonium transporter [Pseudoclavibacter chungangensis]NYJ66472.1 Amt family ammonium transporter [Pseudoclavibacter chungangensis]